MTKVIGVLNRKGGACKTTTVFNMAAILAKNFKKKVLVIDVDEQANLSSRLLACDFEEYNEKNDVGTFLTGKITFEDLFRNPEKINDAIYPARIRLRPYSEPKKRGIDIIPVKPENSRSDYTLADVEEELMMMENKSECFGIVKQMLGYIRRTVKHNYSYDYILFDFPPAVTKVSYACLGACDYIIAPLSPSANAMDGFEALLGTVNKVRMMGINANLTFLGLFFTRVSPHDWSYDRQMFRLAKEEIGDSLIDIPIREDGNVKWAEHVNIPLAWYRRKSGATMDYYLLTQYVLYKLGDLPEELLPEYEDGLAKIKERYHLD